jgi:starch-binding outer membrane protein, SusD/RagB family
MKKLGFYILLVFFVIVQFSCKKELNAPPANAIVSSDVIQDAQSAQVALNGVYYQLAGVAMYGAVESDWYEDRHEDAGAFMSGYLVSNYDDGLSTNTALFTGGNFVLPMWNNFYQVVNAANGVIEGIAGLASGKIPDTSKSRILGEAHFLRAYGHYCLLMYYAQFFDTTSAYGVLLRKTFVTTNNIVQARNTVRESYAYILADIDTAVADAAPTNLSYYATTWAAKALEARLLINRAGPGDYAQVIALTQDIIRNGGFTLENNLQDIFFTNGLASKEVILGVTPEPNQYIKHDDYLNYPEWNATQQMADLLQGDPRSGWVAGQAFNAYFGDSTLCVTKYMPTTLGENGYIFRLSEMYLLEAEAITRSGGNLTDARTLLETVMSHAGVTDFTAVNNASTADSLLIQINNEVVKNLCYEDGSEWFSLLRMPFAQVQAMRPTITSKNQYIMPVPKTELDLNGSMKQNPGYPTQ